MPIYEYQCDQCAHRFEVIQKFSDAPITVCPKCGGPVEKLLSSPAIQFKGSGFYLTDYGRGTSPKESKSGGDKSAKSDSSGSGEKSASGTSSSDSTSSGDTKPAAPAKPATPAKSE